MACKWFLLLCGVGKKERGHTRVVSPGGDGGEVCVATVGAKLHKSVCSFLVTDC